MLSQPGSPARRHKRETQNSGQRDARTEAVLLYLKLLGWQRCAHCCAVGERIASKCPPEQSRAHLSIPTTDKMRLHTRAEEWQGPLTTSRRIEWTLDLLVSVGAALSSRGQPQRIQTEMSHERGKGQKHRTGLISFRNLLDPLLRTFCFKKKNPFFIHSEFQAAENPPPVMRSIHDKTCGLICLSLKSKAAF